jgi:PAS domain S-box-containing protein
VWGIPSLFLHLNLFLVVRIKCPPNLEFIASFLRQGLYMKKPRVTKKPTETPSLPTDEGFRMTFEEAALGMAHVAVDGRWLRINRKLCEILGYCREDLLGMTFQDITYPEDLDLDLAHVQELLDGKAQRYSMEKRYIRKDGSLVWANLTVALLRDAKGAPQYFISLIEDISIRKRMEESIAQSQAELEAQVEQRTSALRALSNRLMQLQDEERRRIARELHDSVGQYLTALPLVSRIEIRSSRNRASSSISVLPRFEPCPICCIRRCLTKPDSHLPRSGMSKALLGVVVLKWIFASPKCNAFRQTSKSCCSGCCKKH